MEPATMGREVKTSEGTAAPAARHAHPGAGRFTPIQAQVHAVCARNRLSPEAAEQMKYLALAATSADGETRTRTGDTTIFSRVLYQLSYLAVAAQEPSAVAATP
jgi:hypothetical protein